jgi:hypothetical protein
MMEGERRKAMRSVFVIVAGVAGGVIIAGVVLWMCPCRWAERKTTEVVAGTKATTAEVSAKLNAASDEASKQEMHEDVQFYKYDM